MTFLQTEQKSHDTVFKMHLKSETYWKCVSYFQENVNKVKFNFIKLVKINDVPLSNQMNINSETVLFYIQKSNKMEVGYHEN